MPSLTKYPASATTSSISTWANTSISWVSMTQAYSDDGLGANITVATFDSNIYSPALKLTNYDFTSIPSNATITGIIMRCETWNGTSNAALQCAKLLDTTRTDQGDNKLSVTSQLTSTTTAIISLGGSADLWGASVNLTVVKNANFGVMIGGQAKGNNCDWWIDYVTLEVCWSVPEVLFSDGFESGDSSAWSETSGTATVSYDTTTKRTGTYSLKVTTDATWEDYSVGFYFSETSVYCRFYMYIDSTSFGNMTSYFAIGQTNRWTSAELPNPEQTLLLQTSGIISIKNEANGQTYNGTNSINVGAWNKVEWYVKQDGAAGELKMWLNDTLEINQTGIDTYLEKALFVIYGGLTGSMDNSGTVSVYFDDYRIATTQDAAAAAYLTGVSFIEC